MCFAGLLAKEKGHIQILDPQEDMLWRQHVARAAGGRGGSGAGEQGRTTVRGYSGGVLLAPSKECMSVV